MAFLAGLLGSLGGAAASGAADAAASGAAGAAASGLGAGAAGAGAGLGAGALGGGATGASVLGPGMTGAGTGAGLGAMLPSTATPSVPELTQVPELNTPMNPAGGMGVSAPPFLQPGMTPGPPAASLPVSQGAPSWFSHLQAQGPRSFWGNVGQAILARHGINQGMDFSQLLTPDVMSALKGYFSQGGMGGGMGQ